MNKIYKFLCILLCFSILSPVSTCLAAESDKKWPKMSESVSAGSAILMNMDTGTILYEKKIDTRRYPASITKI